MAALQFIFVMNLGLGKIDWVTIAYFIFLNKDHMKLSGLSHKNWVYKRVEWFFSRFVFWRMLCVTAQPSAPFCTLFCITLLFYDGINRQVCCYKLSILFGKYCLIPSGNVQSSSLHNPPWSLRFFSGFEFPAVDINLLKLRILHCQNNIHCEE